MRRLLPPLAWTALVAWLSSPSWSSADTSGLLLPLLQWLLRGATPEQLQALHGLLRKTAHVVEYGVLAILWHRALPSRDPRRRWMMPLGLSVLTASLDEAHQAMTLTRTGSVADVLLDSSAAGAALIMSTVGLAVVVRWLTAILLWVAAAGGATLIAVDWSAGVPAGWLWGSVPAAWLALFFWLRRHPP
jgi:VanZ family protein